MAGSTSNTADSEKNIVLEDLRARQAHITGNPPRVLPLTPEEVSQEILEINNRLRRAVSLPPTNEILPFNATMARHAKLYERHAMMAFELFRGALSPRDRELAILRVCWLCQSPLPWGLHVTIGKQIGNLTDAEVARVTVGSAAAGWSEHDRAMLKAVEELRTDSMISDATWTVLSRSLNEKQLIELPILVGQYQGVAYAHNSLRVPLSAGNDGLLAR